MIIQYSCFYSISVAFALSIGFGVVAKTGAEVTGQSSVEKSSVGIGGFGLPRTIHSTNAKLVSKPVMAP